VLSEVSTVAGTDHFGPQGGYVDIDGKRISIGAEIITLSGYSAHADKTGLVNFVRRMRHKPQQVRIVHGDNGAKTALQQAFSDLGISAIIASQD
jgi:metallo-beta-lactamase family protein